MTFYSAGIFFEKERYPSILRAEGCLYASVRVKMGEMGGGKRETGEPCENKAKQNGKKVTENYSNDPTRKRSCFSFHFAF